MDDTNTTPILVKISCDCFCGFVEMYKDVSGFYVRQERKGVTTNFMATEEEADVKFKEFIDDTMF